MKAVRAFLKGFVITALLISAVLAVALSFCVIADCAAAAEGREERIIALQEGNISFFGGRIGSELGDRIRACSRFFDSLLHACICLPERLSRTFFLLLRLPELLLKLFSG